MNFTERIPIERLQLLNNLDLKTYLSLAQEANPTKKYKNEEIKEHFKQIKQYLKNMIKAKGEINQLYKHSEKSNKGRLFGSTSIQALDGMIRGYLFRDISTDVDMVNCHPVLLQYICKKDNIRCPILTEYVENRDNILKDLKRDGEKDPKTLILKIVNSEYNAIRNKSQFIKDLTKEMKTIRGTLVLNDEYKEMIDGACLYNPKNVLGSFINRILCYYENEVLQVMIQHLHHKTIEISSLAFDGALIYGDYYKDDKLIAELQAEINDYYNGMNMKLKYKEHSQIITDDILNGLEVIDDGKTYESIKEDFELTHAKIINKSMFIDLYDKKVSMKSRKELFESYEHIKYNEYDDNGNVKQVSFITTWFGDPTMRLYRDIGVYPPPLSCPKDIYNLWNGFAMENITEYTPANFDVILEHIKILCNRQEEVYDYIVKWIAQMVQYPAIKTKAPTFISKEGVGKSWLIKLFRVMFGNEMVFETSNPSRDVWGDFNGMMMNAFVVNLNEISKKDTVEAEGRIKALITDPTLPINMKGKNQFETQSYHRFISTTNGEEPFTSKKDDRRNAIIRCSDEKKGDHEYFTKLFDCLEDVNIVKSFFEYLKSIDGLDKFHKIDAPITEYQTDLQQLSRTPIELFVRNVVEQADEEEEDEVKYTSKELYDKFKQFVSSNNFKYEVNSNQFSVRLKREIPKGTESHRGSKGVRQQVFNIPLLKQELLMGCLVNV